MFGACWRHVIFSKWAWYDIVQVIWEVRKMVVHDAASHKEVVPSWVNLAV